MHSTTIFCWLSCLVSCCVLQAGCQPQTSTASDPRPETQSPETQSPETQSSNAPAAASSSLADQVPAKDIELQEANLERLAQIVRDRVGKIVVVDIWSTSCAPCMREFPHLVELSKRFPEQVACVSFNVDFIGLKSKPPASYRPPVEDFLRKQQAHFTNLLSASSDEAVLTAFELESIPAILIYDAGGQLVHTLTDVNSGTDGLTYAGDVIPKIEKLLAQ